METNRTLRFAAGIALLTGGAASASAQNTASATMAVSAEVVANCTVAAQPLAFGSVTQAQAPSSGATASIDVACGPGVAFDVALDDGRNSAAGTRRALDPATGFALPYDIYSDAAHTRRWDGLGAGSVSGSTDASGIARLTAYGLIGPAASVAPGSYVDTVTVTVAF